jgi:2,3-bisphosphoglycerate-dependent phosphoglycerate mutase
VQLILVRHALPLRMHSAEQPADPELAGHGQLQAAALAGFLSAEPVHAIVSSPLVRAQQTAQPLAAALGLPVGIEPELAEFDAGNRSYVPFHELREADPVQWAQLARGDVPGHIDVDALRARVTAALERLAQGYPGRQSVAVFCHAGVINAALSAYLGIARALPFAIDYCGVSRLLAARDGRRPVVSVNETGHVRSLAVTRWNQPPADLSEDDGRSPD